MVPMLEVPWISGDAEELMMSRTRPPTTRTRLRLLGFTEENFCTPNQVVSIINNYEDANMSHTFSSGRE